MTGPLIDTVIMPAPSGYSTVTASALKDASGNLIANATIYFEPVLNDGSPTSFRAGGTAQGQTATKKVSATVSSGAFSIVVADTLLTNPIHVGYRVTCIDEETGEELLGPGYDCVQPTGDPWSFDGFVPDLAPQVAQISGPSAYDLAVQDGYSGTLSQWLASLTFNPRGAWSPNRAYSAPLDTYTQGGSTRRVTTSYTSGATFGDTDIANTEVMAAAGTNGTNGANGTMTGTVTGNLAVLGGVVVDENTNFITPGSYPEVQEAWGAADGSILFALTEAGYVGSSVADAAAAVAKVTGIPGVAVDGNTQFISSGSRPDIYEAWGAADGSIAFALTDDGDPAALPRASDPNTIVRTAFYSASVSGSQQVFRCDVGGSPVQLTSSGNNIFTGLSEDGNLVFFTSDRGGSAAPYQMTRYGLHQIPAGTDTRSAFGLTAEPYTGQSLALGVKGRDALTLTQPYNNKSFNIGTRLVDDNSSAAAVNSSDITSFIPCVERDSTSANGGETPGSTAANVCTQLALAAGIRHTSLVYINGVGATAYNGLCKGTTPYANGIAAATAAMGLYSGAGFASFGIGPIGVVHGEQDEANNNTSYGGPSGGNMLQWFTDYNTDYKAITGQAEDVPMIHSQMSSAPYWATLTGHTQSIPQQQLDACVHNPGKLIMLGPKYFLPYNYDDVHLTNSGYQWLGEYFGRCRAALLLGKDWQPLRPISITRWGNASAQILVKFFVPQKPLRIDITNVTEPTSISGQKYGFEIYDPTGAATSIISVQIYGNDGDALLITCNAAPGAGSYLRYAFSNPTQNGVTGVAGPSGNSAGPRGNVRDSTPGLSVNGNPQWNWLVHFNQLIS